MSYFKILIVEDEVLIADMIERYLQERGYDVVGKAISYDEACALYANHQPELVLIDIRLSGSKTGIDLAHFIQEHPHYCPFIFLTSQLDRNSLDLAKATLPVGYLSKPIHKESLYTTIEIGMHNYEVQKQHKATLRLQDSDRYYLVSVDDIVFLQVDHIYVQIKLTDNKQLLQRTSLKEILKQLPEEQFVQTHRSYAINIEYVSHWDSDHLYVQDDAIPVSRSRRKEIFAMLNRNNRVSPPKIDPV